MFATETRTATEVPAAVALACEAFRRAVEDARCGTGHPRRGRRR